MTDGHVVFTEETKIAKSHHRHHIIKNNIVFWGPS